jgi:hypothetical protein
VVIVGLVVAGFAAVLALVHRGLAATNYDPGSTIFTQVCHCRIVTATLTEAVPLNQVLGNLTLSLLPDSTVRMANIGFVIDSFVEGATAPLVIPNSSVNPIALSFDGTSLGTVNIANATITWPGWPRAYRSRADITALVAEHGSGVYRITSDLTGLVWFPIAYLWVVEENPSLPLAQVAINHFFYASIGGTASIPNSAQVSVNLRPVPDGYHYGSATTRILGTSWEPGDTNEANYTMGQARGPLVTENAAAPGGLFVRHGWGVSVVQDLDPNAVAFTLNMTITGLSGNHGTDEGAAFLLYQALLEPDTPDPAPFVTDTCYGDE